MTPTTTKWEVDKLYQINTLLCQHKQLEHDTYITHTVVDEKPHLDIKQ